MDTTQPNPVAAARASYFSGQKALIISMIVANVVFMVGAAVVVYAKFRPQPSHTTGKSVAYTDIQARNMAEYVAKQGGKPTDQPQQAALKTYISKAAKVQFEYPETWTIISDHENGIAIASPPLNALVYRLPLAAAKPIVRAEIMYTLKPDYMNCSLGTIGSYSQPFTRKSALLGVVKDSLTRFDSQRADENYKPITGAFNFNCLFNSYGYEFAKGIEVKHDTQTQDVLEPVNLARAVTKAKQGAALEGGFIQPGRHASGFDDIAEDVTALPEYSQMKDIMMSFRSIN
jgi:hypothetical protein